MRANIAFYREKLKHFGATSNSGWVELADFAGCVADSRTKAHRFLVKKFGLGPMEAVDEFPKAKANTERRAVGRNFYNTPEWKTARYTAFRKHGNACQCCGASAKDGVHLHVDHIKPRSKFPELELNIDNLQILCEDCNLGKSNTDQTDWRPEAEIHQGNVTHLRSIK